jgi:ferredoxin
VRDVAERWAVTVDREVCLGTGLCVVYASGTFAHDEEAKAIVLHPSADDIDAVRVAVEACPTGALHLTIHEGVQ